MNHRNIFQARKKYIVDQNGYCTCKKHKKTWLEGDSYERFGGSACEECIRMSWSEAKRLDSKKLGKII